VKRLALCLFLLCAAKAFGQTNPLPSFPNFTDILLLQENAETNIYITSERRESVSSLQQALDELPMQKKREGVLLRFDPQVIRLDYAVQVAQQVYRCGVPVIYLYDSTGQYTREEIASDSYLFGLSRMPKYNNFLRILDINSFLLLPSYTHTPDRPPLPSRASPILWTLTLIILAVGSYIGGLYISRLKAPWWPLGYLVPITLTAVIAIGRWIPALEMRMPFRILMAERREYLVMSIATALLLAVPAARLKRRTTAILTTLFAMLFVLHFSILPFLLPLFNRTELQTLTTSFDRYGVCIQSTGYTCGPAAAVSALREFDVIAEEGELAIFAHSTSAAGTPPELLCRAMMKLYRGEDIDCDFRSFDRASDLRGILPVLAVVRFGFLVDHYVAVLRVTEDYVTVADPAHGMRILSTESFESEWRRQGIVITRGAAGRFYGTASIPLDKKD
jgi:hypothetical protein